MLAHSCQQLTHLITSDSALVHPLRTRVSAGLDTQFKGPQLLQVLWGGAYGVAAYMLHARGMEVYPLARLECEATQGILHMYWGRVRESGDLHVLLFNAGSSTLNWMTECVDYVGGGSAGE